MTGADLLKLDFGKFSKEDLMELEQLFEEQNEKATYENKDGLSWFYASMHYVIIKELRKRGH